MDLFRDLWCRFRALAGWAQLAIAVLAALVLVSPFASGEKQPVAARGPAPATTTATVAATPSAPPPTTAAVPAGVPAQGDDTSVVRVIDGDTIEVAGGTRVRLIGVDTPVI